MTLDQIKIKHDTFVLSVQEFAEDTLIAEKKANALQQAYSDNMGNIKSNTSYWEKTILYEYENSVKEAQKDYETQKNFNQRKFQEAKTSDEKQMFAKMTDAVEVAFKAKIQEIEAIKSSNEEDFKNSPGKLKESLESDFQQQKEEILIDYQLKYDKFKAELHSFFGSRFETAPSSNLDFWSHLKIEDGTPISYTTYAQSQVSCQLFEKSYSIDVPHLIPFLNAGNIIIKCDTFTKQKALDLAASIILRNLLVIPKRISLHLVDVKNATSNLGELRQLKEIIYGEFISDNNKVSNTFKELNQIILEITKKLSQTIPNFYEYNNYSQMKEKYNILFVSDLIEDVEYNRINELEFIVKNGLRAGVISIVILDEDQLEISKISNKNSEIERIIEKFSKYFTTINLIENFSFSVFKSCYETINNLKVNSLINYINGIVSIEDNVMVSFEKYILPKDLWGIGDATNGVKIPIGISSNNELCELIYGIDANDFSSIIVGEPGQGKSSFFHNLINSVMMYYSPDEVQFYLIDLMAVEFKKYESSKYFLPHLKVIASETDRDFACNVIIELSNEVQRRVNLFSKYQVNSYVEYRNLNEKSENVPHIFLIIDEFVRLFEDNDKISEKIKKTLTLIISQGRKFGIHLVFACQSLKQDVGIKRVISQIPIRVLYKCSNEDASDLLENGNKAISKLSRRGQILLNTNNGKGDDSHKLIQTTYLAPTLMNEILENISNHYHEKYNNKYKTIIYDIGRKATLAENKYFIEFKQKTLDSKFIEIFLGQQIDINSTDFYFNFKMDTNSNLLIIGGESDTSNRILTSALMSAFFNFRKEGAKFYIFNGMNSEDENYEIPNKYFGDLDRNVFIIKSNIVDELDLIQANLDRRMTNEEDTSERIFLIFYSFQQFNEFKIEEFRRKNMKSLDGIISRGSEYNIHVLMQVKDWSGFVNSINGSSKKGFFAHRVALQMSSTDAFNFIGELEPSKLYDSTKPYTTEMAYYQLEGSSSSIKFKAYDYANETWFKSNIT